MQKTAALRAAVFSLSSKHRRGALNNPPPIRARVNQDHGLPQGSMISPTLFLIMISDLTESIRDLAVKFPIYADDVAFCITHHITEARSISYSTLLEISNWVNNWGLIIAPGKSAALIFTPSQILRDTPRPLSINSINIPYVTEYKYLGVTLDHRLNFNKHFEDITQRCARRFNTDI